MSGVYDAVDAAVVACIAAGTNPMHADDVLRLATDALGVSASRDYGPWRLLDRRLQALQKAGRVWYGALPQGKKCWHIGAKPEATA